MDVVMCVLKLFRFHKAQPLPGVIKILTKRNEIFPREMKKVSELGIYL